MKKRGQMKLSFGMIFSIILIIIFIAFAFFAISKFMKFQKEIKYVDFKQDLQQEIDTMWKSSQGSKDVTHPLPKEITSICFVEDAFGENLIYQGKFRQGESFEHLDVTKMLESENREEYCIRGNEGIFTFTIQKTYGESLVTISRI